MAEHEPVISRRSLNLRRGLLCCGIVAPVADVALIAFFASLHPDYDHVRQFMSELGEAGRPFARWVNTWFSIGSLLLVGFGVGLAMALPHSTSARVGASFYLAWASMGVIGGFFPCDPGCRGQTPSAVVHLILGVIASICILPVPVLIWLAIRRTSGWRWHGWLALVVQIFAVVLTLAMWAAAYEAYVAGQPLRELAGLFQRLGWIVYYIWTVALAVQLLRLSRR